MLPTITVVGTMKRIEMKYTQSGKAVAKFQVECAEKNNKGEWTNLYLSGECWEKSAEFVISISEMDHLQSLQVNYLPTYMKSKMVQRYMKTSYYSLMCLLFQKIRVGISNTQTTNSHNKGIKHHNKCHHNNNQYLT